MLFLIKAFDGDFFNPKKFYFWFSGVSASETWNLKPFFLLQRNFLA